ncbi:hypothetical protein SLEP1_g31554 [Rubroshorea leprosula]|uniref:Uncharacterized protein n=1 Tax=Rubroshorea leprosula TaxID=152421 RepID=A0AAV5KB49_9ROSI|nr:hypothetical protein SLEP1_g31554 [Rubroshorea leprosula]
MASRRAGSKMRQVGSSSASGQAQEEGNIPQSNLFLDTQASAQYDIIKNMAVLSCNCVKFSQFPQGDMRVEQIFRELGWKNYIEIKEPVDLPWFDYLLNGKRVNLGRYIFRSIIKSYSPTTGLPHGAIITRLAKRNNIDLTSFRFGTVPDGTTLTKASFEKMDCLFRNGMWIKKGDQEEDEEEVDTDQEMAEQGAEEHDDDSPRPFRVSMQKTNRETMESMISEMQQLHTDFYGFRTKMRERMTNVEGHLGQLVNHFFPPPPPDAN